MEFVKKFRYIIGGVVLAMVVIAFVIFLLIVEPPIVDYKVKNGSVTEASNPPLWNEYPIKKVIKSENPGTILRLPDKSTVILDGTLGIGEKPRHYLLIEGKAQFQVTKGENTFTVVTRGGTVEVLGTDFIVNAKDLLPKAEKSQQGDNGAEINVHVNSGQVKWREYGKKAARIIKDGEDALFLLGEVQREGEICALGFGLTLQKGPQGKILKQRGAKTDALRSISEFSSGMKFKATLADGKLSFQQAEFTTSSSISGDQVQLTLQALDDDIMVCMAKAKIERLNPVVRRNCKVYEGQAGTPLQISPNLPMAITTARNNAILSIIQQAMQDYYGTEYPQEVTGTFYPVSYQAEKKVENNEKYLTSKVSGEVVFSDK